MRPAAPLPLGPDASPAGSVDGLPEVDHPRTVQAPSAVDQVVRAARVVVTDRVARMEVELQPPALGTVRIIADADADGLRLTIQAEEPSTRALLLQALPDIQSALSIRGGLAAAVAIAHGFEPVGERRAPPRRGPERQARFDQSLADRRGARSAPVATVAALDLIV
jgi:hypothetical protein